MGVAYTNPGQRQPAASKERRLHPDHPSARAKLRWLRSLMMRPFRVHWRGGAPQLAWVERRLSRPATTTTTTQESQLARLRAALRAAVPAHKDAALALRELLLIDDQLEHLGWAGAAALPVRVIARAAVQADMLADLMKCELLAELAERLRTLKIHAGPGVAAMAPQRPPPQVHKISEGDAWVEVSEIGEDAYAEAELVWALSSQPAEIELQPLADSPVSGSRSGELKA